MKTTAMDIAMDQETGLSLAGKEKVITYPKVSPFTNIEDGILDSSSLSLLKIECQSVEASDVFQKVESWKSLQEYHNLMKSFEAANDIPRS